MVNTGLGGRGGQMNRTRDGMGGDGHKDRGMEGGQINTGLGRKVGRWTQNREKGWDR